MVAFDLSGALRRIRRLADLSQRELALACRIPQSAVAQAETGRRDLAVGALTTAAVLAGLRLALLDQDGREVSAMAADAVRDLSGRRFPAHLDTRRSDEGQWLHEPRRDRPETSFTFTRDRDFRDARRRTGASPEDHHPFLAGDSPRERKAERARVARRRAQEEFRRRLAAGEVSRTPEFECTCPASCEELDDRNGPPVHAAGCPCSCDVG